MSRTIDHQQIIDMVHRYAETIKYADERPDLIKNLWELSEDISNINPRGHQKGFKELMEGFYPPLNILLSKRELNILGTPSIYLFDNTAIVEFYWQLDATLRDSGEPFELQGRETQVMRKVNGEWKLVHLHYSGMPEDGFKAK